MDNIDDYILSFQNYKEGNYKYETITSLNDVRKAVENGKKFVFLETGAKIGFILGIIFLSIGLIITLILYYFIHDIFLTLPLLTIGISLIPFVIFAIPGIRFLIFGFWRLRTAFLVLGTEGIVYKLKTGGIKGFKWKEISMDIVEETSELTSMISKVIYISMPNGDFINFGRGDYTYKEFPDRKQIGRNQADALFFLTFVNYYYYGKRGTFEPPKF